MNQIIAPIETMLKLCREQTPDAQASYVLSGHCMFVGCDGGRLLFNAMTGELLFFSGGESLDARRDELIRRRFLVPVDFDECAHAMQIRAIAALLWKDAGAKSTFTVLTTTDCNARCPYCYELGQLRKSMGSQVAADVAAYIAEASAGKEVSICWFGGEPLCNMEAIDIIARGLAERGVPFKSRMASNGFYLDAETALRARRLWNLNYVQITLDGTEKRYDEIKSFTDSSGSAFERVLSNIGEVLDAGVTVRVRLNMDSRNVDDLHRLCDVLASRCAGRGELLVSVALVRPLAAKVHEFADSATALESYAGLIEHLDDYGFASVKELPRKMRTNNCMADNRSCEVILPDGSIARCEHVDFEDTVGTIYDPWRDEKRIASWTKLAEPHPQCRTCPLMSRCNMLERCAWWQVGCDEAMQAIRLYNLKRGILAAYESWRKENPQCR